MRINAYLDIPVGVSVVIPDHRCEGRLQGDELDVELDSLVIDTTGAVRGVSVLRVSGSLRADLAYTSARGEGQLA